ncbi:UNVERIFIED_CONTAM: hypothetical protein NCL1_57411 [Trichonephila clavipes]
MPIRLGTIMTTSRLSQERDVNTMLMYEGWGTNIESFRSTALIPYFLRIMEVMGPITAILLCQHHFEFMKGEEYRNK